MTLRETIAENIARVHDRIAQACARVGRDPREVTLVAVTKTHPAEVVDAVCAAGVSDVGENRIQEFLDKRGDVTAPCRWHMVGTLQRNKATKAIGQFDLIHSVDSVKLAHTLDRLGGERGVTTRVLIEVNASGEAAKHGFAPDEVLDTAAEIAALASVDLQGLMTVGPLTDDTTAIRRSFQSLFRLRAKVAQAIGRELPALSMGMTDDFEIAIEEGATIVRLGRVLFGPRRPR